MAASSRRHWFWVLFWVSTFYGVLFIALFLAGFRFSFFWDDDTDEPVKGVAAAGDGGNRPSGIEGNADATTGGPAPTSVDVKGLIEAGLAENARLSDEEKLRRLETKTAEINRIKPENLKSATEWVESLGGSKKDRAYEPRADAKIDWDPDTIQPYAEVRKFDTDSSTFHAMKKLTNKKSQTVYVTIYVDKDGNALKSVTLEAHMSPEDLRLYKLSQMAEKHQGFKTLFDAARRMAQERVDRAEARKDKGGESRSTPPADDKRSVDPAKTPEKATPLPPVSPQGAEPAQP